MNKNQYYSWRSNPQPYTLVMGVLNVTPDSFSDGGQFVETERAIERGLEMIEEGADIIDVGGESTRPGAEPVSFRTELSRVIPVIEGLREHTDTLISIDTYKSDVARQALEAGADLINDISGLTFDMEMAEVVRETGVPVVIMHIKGTPKNMQINPRYENLMVEILNYFQERLVYSRARGINDEQIIIDPGIGFGKRLDDNFKLIRELKQIADLGYPVLVGPSRKSFIGLTLDLPSDQRLEGTAAAVTACVINGAQIIRVHDVQAMKRVITIADKIKDVN